MAVIAPNVISPVLSSTEIIVILFSRVASKARFRTRFGVHPFERDDLRDITLTFAVGFARAVTRFAPDHLSVPSRQRMKLAVLGPVEDLRLDLMTNGTCFATDVIVVGRVLQCTNGARCGIKRHSSALRKLEGYTKNNPGEQGKSENCEQANLYSFVGTRHWINGKVNEETL
jgi:hypothetical protein